eukprot:COSAG01_NODE_9250_length_2504_cov_3.542067_3_plen_238_part_00
MYGHGSGLYRHWTRRATIFFMHSTDLGRSWVLRSYIPWRPAFGSSADGPGEPSTAVLADGSLWCIFRADSTQNYWSARSGDLGVTWNRISKLPFAWSVKPRLRVTTKGLLVLTGGRPGIDMWASRDGNHWSRWNLAAEHNKLMIAAGCGHGMLFSEQVVNVDGPHVHRALPEPETSSCRFSHDVDVAVRPYAVAHVHLCRHGIGRGERWCHGRNGASDRMSRDISTITALLARHAVV